MAGNENSTEKQRIIYLDVLRGLMLVIMTFDHLGGPVKNITFQPLGFVSAAAGFIYLSGFVYGLVYTRTLVNGDFNALQIKSVRRASVIYFYHFLVLLVVTVPMIFSLWDFKELSMFKDHMVKSFLLYAVFLLQPQNMDILPMYVLFILTGPVVVRALIEGKEKLVLLISGLLWFLSQWKIFQYNHFDLTQYGMHLGYFNIFCWQFLFLVGVFFGYSKATGKFRLPVTRRLVVISIIGLLVFIAVRYSARDTFIYRVFSHFSDRSTLGIVRLINFGLIAYLIYILTLKKENILKPGWISFLGRHSLQVFVYSVCLIRLRVKLRPSVVVVDLRPTKTADAKTRFNSSVLAPFFESRACSGVHTI